MASLRSVWCQSQALKLPFRGFLPPWHKSLKSLMPTKTLKQVAPAKEDFIPIKLNKDHLQPLSSYTVYYQFTLYGSSVSIYDRQTFSTFLPR
jgi:hypothetical protein